VTEGDGGDEEAEGGQAQKQQALQRGDNQHCSGGASRSTSRAYHLFTYRDFDKDWDIYIYRARERLRLR